MIPVLKVHYHIIPAPASGPRPIDPTSDPLDTAIMVQQETAVATSVLPSTEAEMHAHEMKVRGHLVETEAQRIVESIKARL